ncbi:head GIN domain-containing protein [Salegentibacter sediminis]|uniref:head GIN domain-containing protein n=1 Tax=Salegentibacter sediminis TaxID=1930251 RepID=UPI0009BDE623|nr:head GIN domain-containing protein [Salegentibacter sediminis]
MKRSILILASLLFSFNLANAQFWKNETVKGNGNTTIENRSTSNYDEVYLVGSMDVELVAGKEGEIKVEAESNLLEHIITEVKNGTLKIRPADKINLAPSQNKSIKVTVPFKDINEVKLTGSGDLWNSDPIRANSFETSLTGSGNLNLNLDVDSLESNITGSGDTMLSGKTNSFECKVTGSGDFQAFDLKAEDVKATVMGSGDIEVFASVSLDAKIMGSGDIHYKGNPEKQDFKTMGSGDITSK